MYSFVRDAVPCKRRRSNAKHHQLPKKRRRIKIRPLSESDTEPELDERNDAVVATADAETPDLDSHRLVSPLENATTSADVEKSEKLDSLEKRATCYDVLKNNSNSDLNEHLESLNDSQKQNIVEKYFQKCLNETNGDVNQCKSMMIQLRTNVRVDMMINNSSLGDKKKLTDVILTKSGINKKRCHSPETRLKRRISKMYIKCFGRDNLASDWNILNGQQSDTVQSSYCKNIVRTEVKDNDNMASDRKNLNEQSDIVRTDINDNSSNTKLTDEIKLCHISKVRSLKKSNKLLDIRNSNIKKVNNLKDHKDFTNHTTDTYYIKKKPAISKEHSISPIILARGVSNENGLSKDKLSFGSSTTTDQLSEVDGIIERPNNPIPSDESLLKLEIKLLKLINLKDQIFSHRAIIVLADYFVKNKVLNNTNSKWNFCDNKYIEDLFVKFSERKHNMAYLSGCLICIFKEIVDRSSVPENADVQNLFNKYMETIINYVQGIDDNLWRKWFLPDSFLDWCIVLFNIFNKSKNILSLSINDIVIANAFTYYAKVKHKQYVYVKKPKPVKKGIFEFSNINDQLDANNELASINNDNTKHQELEMTNCVQQENVSSNNVINLSVNNLLQQPQDTEINNHCAETIRKIKQEYVSENCPSTIKVFSENSTNVPNNSSQDLKKNNTCVEPPCKKIRQENLAIKDCSSSSAKVVLQNSTNVPNNTCVESPCQKIKQEIMSSKDEESTSAKEVLQNSTNVPNKSNQKPEMNNTRVELPCQQIKQEKVSDEEHSSVTVTDIISKSPISPSSVETNYQEHGENNTRKVVKLRNMAELLVRPVSQSAKIFIRREFVLEKTFDANKIRSLLNVRPKRLESEPIMSEVNNSYTNNSLAPLPSNIFEIPVHNKKITNQTRKSKTQVPSSSANAFFTVGNNPQRFNITCGGGVGGGGSVVQNLSPYYTNISANSSISNIESTINNVVSKTINAPLNKSVTDFMPNCYMSNNYNITSGSNSMNIITIPSASNIGNSFNAMPCSSSSTNYTHCAVPTPRSLQSLAYNDSIAPSQQPFINSHPILNSLICSSHVNLNKKQPPSTDNSARSSNCTTMDNNTAPGQNNSYYNPNNIPNTNNPSAVSNQPLMTAPFSCFQPPAQPLMSAPVNFQLHNYNSQPSMIAPINDFQPPDYSAKTSPDLPDVRQQNMPNNMASNARILLALCGAINCVKTYTFICNGCNSIPYCSNQCQEKDWPRHRSQCHLIKIGPK